MDGQQLDVSTEVRSGPAGEVVFVRAGGEVDMANAGELEAAIRSPEWPASAGLVLDLRDVPFMDSSGLQVVLNMARELDRRLAVIVGADSAVTRLFELTGVRNHLRAVSSEREALAALGAGSPGDRG